MSRARQQSNIFCSSTASNRSVIGISVETGNTESPLTEFSVLVKELLKARSHVQHDHDAIRKCNAILLTRRLSAVWEIRVWVPLSL